MEKSHQLNKDLIDAFERIKIQEDTLDEDNRLKERQLKLQEFSSIRGKVMWEGDLMKMREGRSF